MVEGAVGAMVFYTHDFRKDIDGLKEILAALDRICPDRPLREFRCAYARRHGLTSEKSLDARNTDRLMKELAEGKYGSLLLSDSREGVHLDIAASLIIYDGLELGDVAYADLTIQSDYIAKDPTVGERFVGCAKTLWRVADGHYGFIIGRPAREPVVRETSTSVFRESRKYSPDEERQYQELQFYSRNRNNHVEFVRKAYWGNLLSSRHVAKLGGLKRIQADAPCYKIEPLPDGGAYLQLTESPLDFTSPDYVQKLKGLDEFLQPVILPGRPTIAFA